MIALHCNGMADLAQLDLAAKGGEARLRALLEDFVEYYFNVKIPEHDRLALVVWFGKSPQTSEHNLLALYDYEINEIKPYEQGVPLRWKTESKEPPFVNIFTTSVDYFGEQLSSNPQSVARYRDKCEVLYFRKQLLNEQVLRAFNVITEPPGLMKGWYVSSEEYGKSKTLRNLLAARGQRPEIGLVKIEESPDFENCRGLLHAEINQRWLPLSPGALVNEAETSTKQARYLFFNDVQDGRPGYFLFQGGSLYRLVKFEVKTAPEYSTRLLEKLRDDRYAEVYLRAVHPIEQPAA